MADEPYDDDPGAAEEAAGEDWDVGKLFSGDYDSLEGYDHDKQRSKERLEELHAEIEEWEGELEEAIGENAELRRELKRVGTGGSSSGLSQKAKQTAANLPGIGRYIDNKLGTTPYPKQLEALYNMLGDYHTDVGETLEDVEDEVETWDRYISDLNDEILNTMKKRDRIKQAARTLVEGGEFPSIRIDELDLSYDGGSEVEGLEEMVEVYREEYGVAPGDEEISAAEMSTAQQRMKREIQERDHEIEETREVLAEVSRDLKRLDELEDDAQDMRDLSKKTYDGVKEAHNNIGDHIQSLDHFVRGTMQTGKLQKQTQQLLETQDQVKSAVNTAAQYTAKVSEEIVEASEAVRDESVLEEETKDIMSDVLGEKEEEEEKDAVAIKEGDKVAEDRSE